ncbi:MAG TPA: hypothetical protein VJB34_09145 [Bdellovibrionota bacterium]|nr:hypothetical protein [Bdellovibrionota bacterium]
MKSKLTKQEEQISMELSQGKYQSLSKSKQKRYAQTAKHDIQRRKAIRKEARINIRLISEDLLSLKEQAEAEGIPYQTLVASIIHKYLMGSLIDLKNAALFKKLMKQ